MKMGSKIHAKSMKSRGFVADAILERFGCVLGGSPAKRGPWQNQSTLGHRRDGFGAGGGFGGNGKTGFDSDLV